MINLKVTAFFFKQKKWFYTFNLFDSLITLIPKSQKSDTIITNPDGVGPVDNRPSTDKLHLFVQKKKKKK